MANTQFKKGFIPWNKGLIGGQTAWNKGSKGLMKPNNTSFKKGQVSPRKGVIVSFEVRAKMSAARLGKRLSAETRRRMSVARTGAGNARWIADRTQLVKTQNRNDSAYKEWRKSVRDRDGWRCKIADGNCLGKVVAHHILPWSKFPELRYIVNNGITLCRFHHPRKRADEMKLSPYFQRLVVSNSN